MYNLRHISTVKLSMFQAEWWHLDGLHLGARRPRATCHGRFMATWVSHIIPLANYHEIIIPATPSNPQQPMNYLFGWW